MKDIFGRELKDGDVVVVKGGGPSAKPMSVGIFYGKSVTLENGTHRTAKDMFLVENPGQYELDIKAKVEKLLLDRKITNAKKNAKRNAQRADEVGRVYQMAKDSAIWLYCGERCVRVYKNYQLISEKIGHTYLFCGTTTMWHNIDPTKVNFDDTKAFCAKTLGDFGQSYIDVLKSPKSYETEYGLISIPRKFTVTATHHWKSCIKGEWTCHNDFLRVEVEDI